MLLDENFFRKTSPKGKGAVDMNSKIATIIYWVIISLLILFVFYGIDTVKKRTFATLARLEAKADSTRLDQITILENQQWIDSVIVNWRGEE